MTDIQFKPPSKDTPGYLRRQKRALEIFERMQTPSVEALEECIDFVLPFITEPADRETAREALIDVSEEQWDSMLMAVLGKKDPLAKKSQTS